MVGEVTEIGTNRKHYVIPISLPLGYNRVTFFHRFHPSMFICIKQFTCW